MSKSITQDMAYRQSLMKYTEKYGVSCASRKYNKSRSYIYFWKQRWDGSVASLACQSRRPHSHPNQHTEAELKLIRDMRRRNPTLGMIELWHRLRQRGYTRCPESLFRIMRKMGMFPPEKPKKAYKPKPYEQMTYPGQRVQVDVKVVPRACVADPELRLFQYTAIDEFTRLRFLAAYPEASFAGGPETWITGRVENASGRVESICIGGVTVEGTQVRSLFGLRSACFTAEAAADRVTFRVTGFGHGVGMSQYGANRLAQEGKSWQEILHWYYTGVTIAPYGG